MTTQGRRSLAASRAQYFREGGTTASSSHSLIFQLSSAWSKSVTFFQLFFSCHQPGQNQSRFANCYTTVIRMVKIGFVFPTVAGSVIIMVKIRLRFSNFSSTVFSMVKINLVFPTVFQLSSAWSKSVSFFQLFFNCHQHGQNQSDSL